MTEQPSNTEAPPITCTAPELCSTPVPALATWGDGTSADADAATARAAMVARLEESGDLSDGLVRDALLALPREVLMPQAYVRRTGPDQLPCWDLLDWHRIEKRGELLRLLHSGDSVSVQHEGEPILGRASGPRRGGAMTAMSSTMGLTAGLLDLLDLRPGQRVLDVGTGAAVTAAVMCFVCGDAGVVTLDVDAHVGEAARARLAELGYRPTVVAGEGAAGCPDGAPFDRIFVSFAVPAVPPALVAQLAPGGRVLMTVSTSSPSWPGLAVITKTATGGVIAELRAVEFGHRGGVGFDRLFLSSGFREQIATGTGDWTQHSRLRLPADTDRGFWMALDLDRPGLVRNFGAADLTVGAPGCGSWVRVRDVGRGCWQVAGCGPRDIWAELHDVAGRWHAAGSPHTYRLDIAPGAQQRVSSPDGSLSWSLTETPHTPGAAL
ncbi:protein-L-isoaspartate O-methyltransferase family protein [Streptomyces sp. NPDC002746]